LIAMVLVGCIPWGTAATHGKHSNGSVTAPMVHVDFENRATVGGLEYSMSGKHWVMVVDLATCRKFSAWVKWPAGLYRGTGGESVRLTVGTMYKCLAEEVDGILVVTFKPTKPAVSKLVWAAAAGSVGVLLAFALWWLLRQRGMVVVALLLSVGAAGAVPFQEVPSGAGTSWPRTIGGITGGCWVLSEIISEHAALWDSANSVCVQTNGGRRCVGEWIMLPASTYTLSDSRSGLSYVATLYDGGYFVAYASADGSQVNIVDVTLGVTRRLGVVWWAAFTAGMVMVVGMSYTMRGWS